MLNRKGFTLIEIMAVLVLIAIIGTIAAYKLIDLDSSVDRKGIDLAIATLNTNEKTGWLNIKVGSGWVDDADMVTHINYDLGSNYTWVSGPTVSGGTIKFNTQTIVLNRDVSTDIHPGYWRE
jgi:prepilin-type N-terminal cleavage/methylation domain-containing protein